MEETMQVNYLARIEEGMKVFDREHHHIGNVDRVQMSDDDPATPEVEAAEPASLRQRDDSLIDNIAEAFAPDTLPDEVRERLLQQGFVRIDDRYVTPDQILSVSDDEVVLNVGKDELIKRH
jgi:hypothetical protein